MFHFTLALVAPQSTFARISLTVLTAFLFVAGAQSISAATITVNSLADTTATDAACTLREAIANANGNSDTTGGDCTAGSGADTLNISVAGSIDLLSGLVITSDMTINGQGTAVTTVKRAAGAPEFGIFFKSSGTLTMTEMTIRDGVVRGASGDNGSGAGIFNNSGPLILTNVTITNNSAIGGAGATAGSASGGGLASNGPLTLNGVVVSGNQAIGGGGTFSGGSANGGGIVCNCAGTTSISNTVISANTSSGGVGGIGPSGGGATAGGMYFIGGVLTLSNSSVVNNTATAANGATANGGGMSLGDTVSLTNTTVSGNSSNGGTGGLAGGISSGGTLNLTSTTVSGNSATGNDTAGGINSTGNLNLTNSTVSGNSVTGSTGGNGGGIRNAGNTVKLTNMTITNNSAAGPNSGSGIVTFISGTVTLKNTIVAGNVNNATTPDVFNGVGGVAFASQGNNLIGNPGLVNVFIQTGDQTGNAAVPLDPKLAPLGNNGGPTQTHFLFGDSPALDKGAAATDPITNAAITTDQRGFGRPADLPGTPNATNGDGSDIGAFEAQVAPNTASGVSISGRVSAIGARGLVNATVLLTDGHGVTRFAVTGRLGAYRFDDVEAGTTYVVSVASKQFQFLEQVITVSDSLTGVDFVPYAASPTPTGVRGRVLRRGH